MTVTSSKTSCLSFKGYDGADLCVVVRTSNQSLKRQPALWTVHGSGGVSSNDELWHDRALAKGYSIIYVDHYSPRRIYKLNHDGKTHGGIWSIDMAADILLAKEKLDANAILFPWLDLSRIKVVGFSSGATAAMYLTCPSNDHSWIKQVGALYPGIWPLTDQILQIDGSKIKIYVGELDDWTPAKHAITLQSHVKGLSVTVLPDTHHSFSKPGSGGYYEDVINTSDIPYPIPVPMHDVRSRSGEYARLLDQGIGLRRGVHAAYDSDATEKVMSEILA